MAGISLTLEGSNIQLSFQKGEQTTAVLMDQRTAQGLFQALGQMLSAMGGEGDEIEGELVDVTSPSIDIGLDEAGQAVLALQAGPLPPFMLRLKDDEARHIAQSLMEILNSPPDARTSQGGTLELSPLSFRRAGRRPEPGTHKHDTFRSCRMVVRESAPQVVMGSGLSPSASPGMTELNAFVNARDWRDRRAAPYYGLNQEHSGGTMMTRRTVGLGVAGAAAAAGLSKLFGGASEAAPAKTFPVSLPDEEWKKKLSPEQYYVLRQHGTERAGSSPLDREKRRGTFTCAGCGQDLFASETKFDSGTGWPSFFQPLEGKVETSEDNTFFMRRTEVHCANCGGHLGHVFEDGPKPTGLRYCMNGIAMKFRPAEGAA